MLFAGHLFHRLHAPGPFLRLPWTRKTGRNVWKKDRNLEPKDEAQDSYSSPIFLRAGGQTQVVLAGAESVNAYNPATGEQIWICDGLKVRIPTAAPFQDRRR